LIRIVKIRRGSGLISGPWIKDPRAAPGLDTRRWEADRSATGCRQIAATATAPIRAIWAGKRAPVAGRHSSSNIRLPAVPLSGTSQVTVDLWHSDLLFAT